MESTSNLGVPGIHIDPKELSDDVLSGFIKQTVGTLRDRMAALGRCIGGKKALTPEKELQAAEILEDIARLAVLLSYNLSDRQREGQKITAALCAAAFGLLSLIQNRDEHLQPMVSGPKIYLPESVA